MFLENEGETLASISARQVRDSQCEVSWCIGGISKYYAWN